MNNMPAPGTAGTAATEGSAGPARGGRPLAASSANRQLGACECAGETQGGGCRLPLPAASPCGRFPFLQRQCLRTTCPARGPSGRRTPAGVAAAGDLALGQPSSRAQPFLLPPPSSWAGAPSSQAQHSLLLGPAPPPPGPGPAVPQPVCLCPEDGH